jgi:NAD(P)-dependent dehydrogenase (short-subunit alcohol dehydrogenase family)
MPPKPSFKDKVVIVTGGASGIGRAVCAELGLKGAALTVADIDVAGAEKTASAIVDAGGSARALRVDVTNADEVQKLVTETAEEHGRLDYIFNNAGIAIIGEVRDMNLENWRKIVDINLWGVIYGTMAAYPLMIEQGFGHIVNIASAAGLVGIPMFASYCTTKHAVVGLSTALRHEAAGLGVNVSVVCPGFIRTELFENSQLLNLEREGATAPAEAMSIKVADAALRIIRGVEKNKPIINFPFSARILWWLHRLHPSILSPVMSKAVKDFRANRVES